MKPTLCVYCGVEPFAFTYAIGLVAIPVCARKRCTATFDEDSAAVHARVREGRVDTSTRETRDALRAALGRDLYTTAVLSGNRNFDGRIHPYAKQAFLASPPLVVAYAIAGTIRFDIENDVLALVDGKEIRLKDIWPSRSEEHTLKSA